MIHGIDTGFLVAAEILEHTEHKAARQAMVSLRAANDQIAIAPRVLAEFIHVVTDRQRFALPLNMSKAIHVTKQWWTARDIVQVFPMPQRCISSRPGSSSFPWAARGFWIHYLPQHITMQA